MLKRGIIQLIRHTQSVWLFLGRSRAPLTTTWPFSYRDWQRLVLAYASETQTAIPSHEELQILYQRGLTPEQVLNSATSLVSEK